MPRTKFVLRKTLELPAVDISLLQGITDTSLGVEPEPEETPNLN